jgi:hypothetical protein
MEERVLLRTLYSYAIALPPGGWADEAFLFFRTSEFLLVKDVSVDTVRGAN